MIKKIIIFCLVIRLFTFSANAISEESISAECAVLINAQSNDILFSKRHLERRAMASTTKIMTSLLAIESGKLQSEIVVTGNMLNVEGTSMGLKDGDSVSLLELVYGMMLSSGNDAANVTAIYLAGDIEKFALKMNDRANVIGMSNTNFVTPSGLDSEEHYSTAYDMALLGAEAVKNPLFLSICSDVKETLTYGNPPYKRTVYNHNKLLGNYDYVLGIKTGFTKKSGRCLVSYAVKGSKQLIAVTLNAPDDWRDHKKMFDFGFETLKEYTYKALIPEKLSVVGSSGSVDLFTEPFIISSDKQVDITGKTYVEKFLYAPVKTGMVVGFCEYYVDGNLAETKPIIVNINKS